ncbi:MAG: bifunctional riboflavin kinase/FAD synthetase [Clostridia bacterium]|nr:bifunctional riboflavin kinase/FAD synthetase [Clostridia bacterium]
MEIIKIYDDTKLKNEDKLAICLGTFDGMHSGHKSLALETVKTAEENSLIPAAAVFEPENFSEKIITSEKKYEILSALGIERIYVFYLTEKFRNTSPEAFVKEWLSESLNACSIVCGFNYTFGKNKQGTASTLLELSCKYGFSLTVKDGVKRDGIIVSSTVIRNFLKNGEIKKANEFSGYIYNISGKVEQGNHIGRTLDFPTANVYFDKMSVKLKRGVYLSETDVDGKLYKSITNVGNAPTFGEKKYLSETHIIGFEGDIYGEEITVYFYDFLREEKKFTSPDELIETIKNDIKNAELMR